MRTRVFWGDHVLFLSQQFFQFTSCTRGNYHQQTSTNIICCRQLYAQWLEFESWGPSGYHPPRSFLFGAPFSVVFEPCLHEVPSTYLQ